MTNLSFSETPSEWAAFVAIDWADDKHSSALTQTASGKLERGELDATPEAVESLGCGAERALLRTPHCSLPGTEARRPGLYAR